MPFSTPAECSVFYTCEFLFFPVVTTLSFQPFIFTFSLIPVFSTFLLFSSFIRLPLLLSYDYPFFFYTTTPFLFYTTTPFFLYTTTSCSASFLQGFFILGFLTGLVLLGFPTGFLFFVFPTGFLFVVFSYRISFPGVSWYLGYWTAYFLGLGWEFPWARFDSARHGFGGFGWRFPFGSCSDCLL